MMVTGHCNAKDGRNGGKSRLKRGRREIRNKNRKKKKGKKYNSWFKQQK